MDKHMSKVSCSIHRQFIERRYSENERAGSEDGRSRNANKVYGTYGRSADEDSQFVVRLIRAASCDEEDKLLSPLL